MLGETTLGLMVRPLNIIASEVGQTVIGHYGNDHAVQNAREAAVACSQRLRDRQDVMLWLAQLPDVSVSRAQGQ